MTSQNKGLGLSNLPPPLFGYMLLKFITELGECEPGSEHIVLRLSSNAELPASTNFTEDISGRHNSYPVLCTPGRPTTELLGLSCGDIRQAHQTPQGDQHQAGPRLALFHKG